VVRPSSLTFWLVIGRNLSKAQRVLSSTFLDFLSLSLGRGFQYTHRGVEGVLGFGESETYHCVSLVPRGTLQIRIRFVRQRSFLPLKQTNMLLIYSQSMNKLFCCPAVELFVVYPYKKQYCCPALELFSCSPLWKTLRLPLKKATKCNKSLYNISFITKHTFKENNYYTPITI
jgi:hypothetical protein